jgi:hypothetical protein
MRRNLLVSILVVLAVTPAGAQMLGHVLRESVAKWGEPDRSRALSWLDHCRASADDYAAIWLRGDDSARYAATAREFRANTSFSEFAEAMRAMRQAFGEATALEFRSDAIIQGGGSPGLLNDPDVQVVYATSVTRPLVTEVFLEIYLGGDGGSCRVTGMRYQTYFNAVPWWLRKAPRPAAPPAT